MVLIIKAMPLTLTKPAFGRTRKVNVVKYAELHSAIDIIRARILTQQVRILRLWQAVNIFHKTSPTATSLGGNPRLFNKVFQVRIISFKESFL